MSKAKEEANKIKFVKKLNKRKKVKCKIPRVRYLFCPVKFEVFNSMYSNY